MSSWKSALQIQKNTSINDKIQMKLIQNVGTWSCLVEKVLSTPFRHLHRILQPGHCYWAGCGGKGYQPCQIATHLKSTTGFVAFPQWPRPRLRLRPRPWTRPSKRSCCFKEGKLLTIRVDVNHAVSLHQLAYQDFWWVLPCATPIRRKAPYVGSRS